MKRHWPIFVVVLLAIVAIRQSSSIHARGVERTKLEVQLEIQDAELAATNDSNSQTPVRSELGFEELEFRSSRVHLLRGDVTMARKELAQIASAVAKLSQQYVARSNQLAFAQAPVFPKSYRQGSGLRNVGQASPEATVESFFYASIAGDVELAIRCFDELAERTDLDTEEKQRTANQMKQMFARFPGYKLITRERLAQTRTRLDLRTSPESKIIQIVLDLTDRQWVINADKSELFK